STLAGCRCSSTVSTALPGIPRHTASPPSPPPGGGGSGWGVRVRHRPFGAICSGAPPHPSPPPRRGEGEPLISFRPLPGEARVAADLAALHLHLLDLQAVSADHFQLHRRLLGDTAHLTHAPAHSTIL